MEQGSNRNEEFVVLISSEISSDESSNRSSPSNDASETSFLKKRKNLFCSGVFLRGMAHAVGFWNPSKGLHVIMAIVVLFVDICYVFKAVYYAFLCGHYDTSFDRWMCRNGSQNSSSTHNIPVLAFLPGVELNSILSLVTCLAGLMSNAAFFWCMWNSTMKRHTANCVTLEQAYSTAGRSFWTTLNCTMLLFGLALMIGIVWINLTFKGISIDKLVVSLRIIPMLAILTSCYIFSLITNAMKDCVTSCFAEIRNSINSSLDDIIRIHKHLCEQLFCTSNSLKLWFLIHWFLLAVAAVVYVADMVGYYQTLGAGCFVLTKVSSTVILLYAFIYPSYCAASVTARCNQMLKEINITSNEEWDSGHPFRSRAQLALFIQYAQYTDCGFRAGGVTFGSNFAWFSTLIAMCGIGVKVL
ncbi:uncharacterized protein LOC111319458 [Stylophora pistillata]|uniref:uncharacterized protein LOC111319458 n=1 Tax=Stylophora pistillata TaxID=50429 RepID=UPI000C053A9D|nr:uncharacterized protein LOC111319458 [Stylophora pistillata]